MHVPLIACLTACGDAAAVTQAQLAGLPAVSNLDTLHGALSVADQSVPVEAPLLSGGSTPSGTTLGLSAVDESLAFAVYRIDKNADRRDKRG